MKMTITPTLAVILVTLIVVGAIAAPQDAADKAEVESAAHSYCASDAIPEGTQFKKVTVVRDCVVLQPVTIRGDKAEARVEYVPLAELVPGPILRNWQFVEPDGSTTTARRPIKVRGAITLIRTADGWSTQLVSPEEFLVTGKGVAAYLSGVRDGAKTQKMRHRAEVALKQLQKLR